MKIALAFAAVLAIGAAVLLGLGQNRPSPQARGQVIYAEDCASCHGVNLEGQENWRAPTPDGIFPAPPHDTTGHTWHHDDTMLFEYTKFGGQKAMETLG